MKLIVLAAGQGTRLRPLTDGKPKCCVPLHGTALLDWQIRTAHQAGVSDIVVIKGCHGDVLVRDDVTFATNPRFAETNMVYTLACALEQLTGDCLISYGDIVYDRRVLDTIMAAPQPISVVVDMKWREYWEKRSENPLDDAETLRLDGTGQILEIGQKPESLDDIQGQYIGLMKFDAHGVEMLKTVMNDLRVNKKPGQKDFDNLYFTDLMQHMIGSDIAVQSACIDGGWLEIDTLEDLALAENLTSVVDDTLHIER